MHLLQQTPPDFIDQRLSDALTFAALGFGIASLLLGLFILHKLNRIEDALWYHRSESRKIQRDVARLISWLKRDHPEASFETEDKAS